MKARFAGLSNETGDWNIALRRDGLGAHCVEMHFEDITLRDMTLQDIDDDVRWYTVETEWMDWDAPWEKDDPFDERAHRLEKLERITKHGEETRTRYTFEIDYAGRHIGWVNAYNIDEDNNYAKEGQLCVGICICEPDCWGRGVGGRALASFTGYLFSRGYRELYTQTWSGNERLLRMAQRIGFKPWHRDADLRQVRGQTYDRVTLRLTPE